MDFVKIAAFDVFQFALPLLKPLTTSYPHEKFREGILIKLTAEKGQSGFGEISPLPGVSRETLLQAKSQIFRLKEKMIGVSLPAGTEKLTGNFIKQLDAYKLFPSVRFGIEMAVLDLLEQSPKSFPHHIFKKRPQAICLNGLLTGTKDEVISQAKRLLGQGFRKLKIKVGRRSLKEDIEIISEIKKLLPANAMLRIDVNRAWGLSTAVRFANAIGRQSIEYIEEPLKNPRHIPNLFKRTSFPITLDESITQFKGGNLKNFCGIHALIIKPMIVGGFKRSLDLIELARKYGIKTVISSSFESGVGLAALVNFAAYAGTNDVAHGLDTQKFFRTDLLTNAIPIIDGCIKLSDVNRIKHNLRMDLLTTLHP